MSSRLKALLELHEKDPSDSFVTYGIALEYISQKNYTEAEVYLKSLLKGNPDYLPAYMQLAQLYEKTDNIDAAKNIYKTGIEIARKQNETRTEKEMEDFLSELE